MPTLRIDMLTGDAVMRIYKKKISSRIELFPTENIFYVCIEEIRYYLREKIIKRMFYDYMHNDPEEYTVDNVSDLFTENMITKLFEESIREETEEEINEEIEGEIQIPDIERFILDRIPRLYFKVTYSRETSDKDREIINQKINIIDKQLNEYRYKFQRNIQNIFFMFAKYESIPMSYWDEMLSKLIYIDIVNDLTSSNLSFENDVMRVINNGDEYEKRWYLYCLSIHNSDIEDIVDNDLREEDGGDFSYDTIESILYKLNRKVGDFWGIHLPDQRELLSVEDNEDITEIPVRDRIIAFLKYEEDEDEDEKDYELYDEDILKDLMYEKLLELYNSQPTWYVYVKPEGWMCNKLIKSSYFYRKYQRYRIIKFRFVLEEYLELNFEKYIPKYQYDLVTLIKDDKFFRDEAVANSFVYN